jgi:Lipocalin-like domain
MRRVWILLGSLGVLATWPEAASPQGAKRPSAVEASRAANHRIVGTWKLIAIERFAPNGEFLPPPAPPAFGSPNPTGFIVYDAAGYMGVTIMQSGRQKFAGAQPTADEAKAALLGYISYCGTFSVNGADGVVTHHIQTSLNPNDTDADQRSSFQVSGNRLVLKPSRDADGLQAQLTWERVPDLTALTPMHRRLIGLWKQVSTERRTFDGKLVRTEPPRVGLLTFSAAGHMAVYVMDPGRKKYAAADPTPEEARQALTTYGSYFGPYEVSDKESYEVTRQVGTINPAQVGQLALRRLTFVGDNRVILKPPPAILDGQLVQGYVAWERVTPPVMK